jgi:diadenosine tetraphosphate (Ap4A) HIT family hydrolase
MECSLCDRLRLLFEGKYPYVVHEFKNSFLVLGEHQFFLGYCILISKKHYKEMTDIPAPEQEEIFQEMMTASKLIEKSFGPDKMNMCSLGNVVPHVHWHFFPRYKSDPEFSNPPWLSMHLFEKARIDDEKREKLIETLRRNLP